MNVYIYVCDALRPDYLGCYGYNKNTSPHIDAIANESILFTNAYGTASWTKPSGTSLLTGQYPRALNIKNTFDKLSESVTLLPEVLQNYGYTTCGVTTQGFISERFGLASGYDNYVNLRTTDDSSTENHTTSGPSSEKELKLADSRELNEEFLALLDGSSGNTFGLAWSVDTHYPYLLPNEFQRSNDIEADTTFDYGLKEFASEFGVDSLRNLYQDAVRFNDDSIGKFIKHLKSENEYRDSLILVTGDHGEEFDEHGHVGHSGIVNEPQVKVPLLLKLPGNEYGGRRVTTPVSLVDIFPTVVNQVNASLPHQVDGTDVTELVETDERDSPILAETHPNPGTALSRAVWYSDLKWMDVSFPRITEANNMKELASNILSIPDRVRWRDEKLYKFNEFSDDVETVDRTEEPAEMYNKREGLLRSIDERESSSSTEKWDSDDESGFKDRLRKLGYIE